MLAEMVARALYFYDVDDSGLVVRKKGTEATKERVLADWLHA